MTVVGSAAVVSSVWMENGGRGSTMISSTVYWPRIDISQPLTTWRRLRTGWCLEPQSVDSIRLRNAFTGRNSEQMKVLVTVAPADDGTVVAIVLSDWNWFILQFKCTITGMFDHFVAIWSMAEGAGVSNKFYRVKNFFLLHGKYSRLWHVVGSIS